MGQTGIPSNEYKKDKEVWIMRFVFINFQADNYGTSAGGDEGNCVYS